VQRVEIAVPTDVEGLDVPVQDLVARDAGGPAVDNEGLCRACEVQERVVDDVPGVGL
jgi:hypothetical protein